MDEEEALATSVGHWQYRVNERRHKNRGLHQMKHDQ
jgi:hypothetical protein